jgi:hypothetical protein
LTADFCDFETRRFLYIITMLSLKFATIVVVVVSAALFVSVATADVVLPLETRMQIEEAATSVSGSSSHYESPPCQSDEKAVRIMGIDGSFCR